MTGMYIDDLIIDGSSTVFDAMKKLDERGKRILFIAPEGKLCSVLSDGDVRRHILKGGSLSEPVENIANKNFLSLGVGDRARAPAFLVKHSISAVPLLDSCGRIVDAVFLDESGINPKKQLDIPVVIMAGGLGTRLYPYTKILPKPLIPVGEKPIAEHIIDKFRSFGCTDFRMIVNHKKNMIKAYFGDRCPKGAQLQFVEEEKFLGTGGGLSLLKGSVDSSFFLTNCDVLIDADYADIYNFHKKYSNLITVVCALKHVTIPYGVFHMSREGEIESIEEKPTMTFLTNTGMYIAEPRVIEEMPDDTPLSFPDILEKYRLSGEKIGVYPVSEDSWMDMGQLEELENMRRKMENG